MFTFAYQLLVTGRVQGVGFRAFARNLAREFNVRCNAKNLSNGQVEIRIEFSIESASKDLAQTKASQLLSLFSKELSTGNRFARVEHIDIREVDVEGFNSFS